MSYSSRVDLCLGAGRSGLVPSTRSAGCFLAQFVCIEAHQSGADAAAPGTLCQQVSKRGPIEERKPSTGDNLFFIPLLLRFTLFHPPSVCFSCCSNLFFLGFNIRRCWVGLTISYCFRIVPFHFVPALLVEEKSLHMYCCSADVNIPD